MKSGQLRRERRGRETHQKHHRQLAFSLRTPPSTGPIPLAIVIVASVIPEYSCQQRPKKERSEGRTLVLAAILQRDNLQGILVKKDADLELSNNARRIR